MIDINLPVYAYRYLKHYRYKGIKGGRSSTKTTTVARRFIVLALEEQARFLCCRHIQKSLKQSTYQALKKAVHELGLTNEFMFTIDRVICRPTQSEFLFIGLSTNIDEVRSLENIKYVWIDEAETVTHEAFKILLPTIRTKGSEIWCTWNPKSPTSAVHRLFKTEDEHTIVTHVTYKDNPYFHDDEGASEIERQRCLRDEPELYSHIWLGAFLPEGDNLPVLPYTSLIKCVGVPDVAWAEAKRNHVYAGLDLGNGGKDASAYAIRQGPVVKKVDDKRLEDATYVMDWFEPTAIDHNVVRCHYDVIGVGAGAQAEFSRRKRANTLQFIADPFCGAAKVKGQTVKFVPGRTNEQHFRNLKAQGWWNLRLRLNNSLRFLRGEAVGIHKCFFLAKDINEKVLHELAQVCYTLDNSDKILIDKMPDGEPSPNMADGVMMSYARDLIYGLRL